jgi:disulfide bond formation protein DsbB
MREAWINQIVIYAVSFAAVSLLIVHLMQNIWHIMPCELCLWQRYPYYIILSGAVLVPLRYGVLALKIQFGSFLVGAGLALYHTGLERNWWLGGSCTTQKLAQNASPQDILLQLQASPLVKCDQISWHLWGLSLTNYNLLLCLVGAGVLGYFLLRFLKSAL